MLSFVKIGMREIVRKRMIVRRGRKKNLRESEGKSEKREGKEIIGEQIFVPKEILWKKKLSEKSRLLMRGEKEGKSFRKKCSLLDHLLPFRLW